MNEGDRFLDPKCFIGFPQLLLYNKSVRRKVYLGEKLPIGLSDSDWLPEQTVCAQQLELLCNCRLGVNHPDAQQMNGCGSDKNRKCDTFNLFLRLQHACKVLLMFKYWHYAQAVQVQGGKKWDRLHKWFKIHIHLSYWIYYLILLILLSIHKIHLLFAGQTVVGKLTTGKLKT